MLFFKKNNKKNNKNNNKGDDDSIKVEKPEILGTAIAT